MGVSVGRSQKFRLDCNAVIEILYVPDQRVFSHVFIKSLKIASSLGIRKALVSKALAFLKVSVCPLPITYWLNIMENYATIALGSLNLSGNIGIQDC